MTVYGYMRVPEPVWFIKFVVGAWVESAVGEFYLGDCAVHTLCASD